jgi:hypothetical protein
MGAFAQHHLRMPDADALSIEDLRNRAPICHTIVVSCVDILLQENCHSAFGPFQAFVEELVHHVYDRYLQSQRSLPLAAQWMPEEGKS